MTSLLAWLWVPLLLYVVLLGVGLLADRLAGADLPAPLIAPIGLAVATVLMVVCYRVAQPLALPVLLAAVLAGFVLARRGLRRRVWAPPVLAAAGLVYALYMAPIVLSGEATWAGYNFVNDTATNFVLAATPAPARA